MTDNASLRINLDDPAALKLQAPGVSFDQAIRSLCRLVDQFQGRQPLLDLSGIDESFYRILGMMFSPELLGSGTAPGTSSTPSHSLHRVCDFIVANLYRPLTLTDLEEVAGLSARSLQLQFLKQFGCSPMAWLRDQRLEVAHQRLLHDHYVSVTQISMDVGFVSPSRFAAAYKTKFGVLPSESRKNLR
jgi:AraC-like DNA-binding protein